jgi:hypothetical protein
VADRDGERECGWGNSRADDDDDDDDDDGVFVG